MTESFFPPQTRKKLIQHYRTIYGENRISECLEKTNTLIEKYHFKPAGKTDFHEVWTQKDQILITYGDMIKPEPGQPESRLHKLHEFLRKKLKGLISTVHILPFFPSSSDDGFSVVDYKRVDERLGGWGDIEAMSRDFRLMGDLVMNHISRHSLWFQKYLRNQDPYRHYFIEVDPGTDMSAVTRPRSSPVLTPVHTKSGEKWIWTTFSDDQIDVNFANPDVLFEYIDIFLFYVSRGLSVIRLDAVAFIWKEPGTSCIHLKETHEIVKLFRTLLDCYAPEATLITETNVPHEENISYFGKGDEAHMVYQFSLPPLLLHALLTGNAGYLSDWASSLKTLPENCTYFNFTASHDGIGVRPLEGLVPQEEFDNLVEGIRKKGGFVSEKENPDGSLSPYELNITYFYALADDTDSKLMQERRFICSQIIAMSLQGVPGVYFHNLTATRNHFYGVSVTGRVRTINRKKWYFDDLAEELSEPDSAAFRIFRQMKRVITRRWEHPAFHPFGGQRVHSLGSNLFCIERWDPEETERILVIANVTRQKQNIVLKDTGLLLYSGKLYTDFLSGQEYGVDEEMELPAYGVVWLGLP